MIRVAAFCCCCCTAILILLAASTTFGTASAYDERNGKESTASRNNNRYNTAPSSWIARTASTFPNPAVDKVACRTTTSLQLCDPDKVLRDQELEQVDAELVRIRRLAVVPSCRPTTAMDGSSGNRADAAAEVQYAVALTEKMDLSSFQADSSSDAVDAAVQVFARQVHDAWGVGMETVCGGTGVLLFLSDNDRAIYISRGKALEHLLTDRRLDRVIESMKPYLQRKKYSEAIVLALRTMDDFIEKGRPAFWERLTDWLTVNGGIICVALFFVYAFFAMRRQQQEERTYAQVASHLSDLDRSRAEALQGRYRALSCPICLENFQIIDGEPKIGSDGLPLKLLRCGHVFDESCWRDWVARGQGHINLCPICQQPVGGNSVAANPNDNDVTLQRRNVHLATTRQDESSEENETQMRRIRRLYDYERAFRLHRLMDRYPRYVRSDQVDLWTRDSYSGSLVRDRSFVESNPTRSRPGGSGGSRGRGSGGGGGGGGGVFGGGSSGGGRSGRW